jgi:hypothetical protein
MVSKTTECPVACTINVLHHDVPVASTIKHQTQMSLATVSHNHYMFVIKAGALLSNLEVTNHQRRIGLSCWSI